MTGFCWERLTNGELYDRGSGVQEVLAVDPPEFGGAELLRVHAGRFGIRLDEAKTMVKKALAEVRSMGVPGRLAGFTSGREKYAEAEATLRNSRSARKPRPD